MADEIGRPNDKIPSARSPTSLLIRCSSVRGGFAGRSSHGVVVRISSPSLPEYGTDSACWFQTDVSPILAHVHSHNRNSKEIRETRRASINFAAEYEIWRPADKSSLTAKGRLTAQFRRTVSSESVITRHMPTNGGESCECTSARRLLLNWTRDPRGESFV